MPISTIDTSSISGLGYGFKNRIINGAMVIDQRNAGASVTPAAAGSGTYTLDRWNNYASQASKYTVQQNSGSVTPPPGFPNYLGVVSSSAYSITSTDIFLLRQAIEGYNVADLGWGTANAHTVTLSFWVRSSLTGTFGGSFQNAAQTRNYPFSYTISAANTWEQKTITVAGDTSGTWLTTNGVGLFVNFSLGTGSTYSGTANAWASGGPFWSTTGAVNLVGTSGATFYITGVQLEKGTVATSFDWRPYSAELALCQRYYEIISKGIGGSGGYGTIWSQPLDAFTNCWTPVRFAVVKRATGYSFGLYSGVSWSSSAPTTIYTGAVDAIVFHRAGFYYLQGSAGTDAPMAFVSSEL